ncbi:hypothetical protein PUN28_000362 [Cardiocondyla obscurior]|uniref:Uncharacterized protein n=1 Tax=Cardiocondyla obscurior TaxID=286306 RepID=A0AAW2GZ30_9HYME
MKCAKGGERKRERERMAAVDIRCNIYDECSYCSSVIDCWLISLIAISITPATADPLARPLARGCPTHDMVHLPRDSHPPRTSTRARKCALFRSQVAADLPDYRLLIFGMFFCAHRRTCVT